MCEVFSIDDVPNKRQVASAKPKDFKNHHRARMPTRLREEKTKDLVVLVMITEYEPNAVTLACASACVQLPERWRTGEEKAYAKDEEC